MEKLFIKKWLALGIGILVLVIIAIIVGGCGKKGNVSEIIKNYQKYVNKEVELSGYTSQTSGDWSYYLWDKPDKGGEGIGVKEFGTNSTSNNLWKKMKVIIRQEGSLIYAEVTKPIEVGD